jgi:hypothetical protein
MFEIVRQDPHRCIRVNQAGYKDFSAYLRELFNPGRVIPKTSGRRKPPATPKPQSSAAAASVPGSRLATF